MPEDAALTLAEEPQGSGAAPAPAPSPTHETLLYIDGVSVSFDGFKALNNLSLVVEAGELRTIIGPNGAGKTTMMDVVTGKTRPDHGAVSFNGDIDLTKLDEVAIARLGIGRKFQRPTVFEKLSVWENLDLAIKDRRGVFHVLFSRLKAEQRRRIEEILEVIGLADRRHEAAGLLSHGQKQWLEIGMLLIQDPQLLLLDEPVAGMTDKETERTAELILDIARQHTVIVVEHDMAFVRDLGAKTTVLHEGSVLAEGTVEAVQNHPRVIEVYLGR
ncbi:MAG: urea ABC transporter ATP-binding protein UrtD [Alphaproteobacteria bacterium]|jgi:urea transport system ATP-binding protein|nr:urea ABC transporter ATP-binding protein UrtD [Alphaproteobacteria bacterium]